ncbi:hypothetical protein BGZ74_004081, partial [Mortierella antarctica]
MALFKNFKNQSLSASSSQSPRSSMQGSRPSPQAQKMTQQEALEKLMTVTMGDATN